MPSIWGVDANRLFSALPLVSVTSNCRGKAGAFYCRLLDATVNALVREMRNCRACERDAAIDGGRHAIRRAHAQIKGRGNEDVLPL
jgi:hypothetical protein